MRLDRLLAFSIGWRSRRAAALEIRQAGLEITNDLAQKPRCEQPRPERTGSVLPDGRELSQDDSDRRGHVTKLPADLLTDCVWTIGGSQAGGLGGIRGGAQSVRAHMWDGCGLSGRFGGGHCCGSADLTSGAAILETTADLLRDVKLATSEGSRPGDRLTGPAIPRSFRLEQSQHPLSAVRRPHSDDPPVSFAQRLGRAHDSILPRGSAPGRHGADRQPDAVQRLAEQLTRSRFPIPQHDRPSGTTAQGLLTVYIGALRSVRTLSSR